jgi:GGDEF domain-containing protein
LRILLLVLTALAVPSSASAQDGGALYQELCSSCHDTAVDRAPSREALRAMSPQRILDAMEAGPMVAVAQLRTGPADERALSASFGVAPVNTSAELGRTLASADAALYRAKNGGRNRVVSAEG